MKYMGSKNRHAKEIISILNKHRKPFQLYVEPFVGGANIIDKMDSPRHGNDIDEDLICLWQSVSNGWMPPKEFTEQRYKEIKTECVSPERGYAAFALSYGGKKFGGWCRDKAGKRNYIDEAYRNACLQFPLLRDVLFTRFNYSELNIPDGSLVYCDPPYAGTTKYTSDFNHDFFWQWVRNLSENNTVFVSEYTAPDDFMCVWEKEVSSSLTSDTGSKRNVEKLWRIK